MKKADLRTGVIYAYRTSKWSGIKPVVLLDTTVTYQFNSPGRWRGQDTAMVHPRPGQPASANIGYLALTIAPEGRGRRQRPLRAEELPGAFTLEQAQALTVDQAGDFPFAFTVVNPRFLLGEYAAVLDREQAEAQRKNEARIRHNNLVSGLYVERNRRLSALEHLVPGDLRGQGPVDPDLPYTEQRVRLTLAQVDALLAQIPTPEASTSA